MEPDQQDRAQGGWRIVVLTVVPGGTVYRQIEEVIRPLGHRVVGVLTTPGPRDRRNTGFLDVVAAVPPEIDVIVSTHPARWAAMLAPLRPDLIISAGMPWRLPPEMIALPRLGAINAHPALLPRLRGPSPIEWSFRNGEPTLGMTIHCIDPTFDSGPILAQGAVPIDDDDDFQSLLSKLVPLFPRLVERALERVANGDPGEPQDESQATYAGRFEEAWRTINWDAPARMIHNQVRSWGGFGGDQGAIGEVAGNLLQVTRTRLLTPTNPNAPASPGTLLGREGGDWIVQCGDGPIALVQWRLLAKTAS
jgi:methionyl-tRNA formyltransferase